MKCSQHLFHAFVLTTISLTTTLVPALAHADIIGTTGAVTIIPAPANVTTGVFESDTEIRVFPELQNITLNTGIEVDITTPGTSPWGGTTHFSSGTIPAGTVVSSFYEHVDSVSGTANHAVVFSGSISFDSDILGLIVTDTNLNASASYPGLPSVIYGTDSQLEIVPGGVGQNNNDQIILSSDRRTVTFNLRDGNAPDDVRIITAVPEPSTLALLGISTIGLLGCAWRRRRVA